MLFFAWYYPFNYFVWLILSGIWNNNTYFIIGIIIASLLVSILLIGLLVFCTYEFIQRRKRRQNEAKPEAEAYDDATSGPAPEVDPYADYDEIELYERMQREREGIAGTSDSERRESLRAYTVLTRDPYAYEEIYRREAIAANEDAATALYAKPTKKEGTEGASQSKRFIVGIKRATSLPSVFGAKEDKTGNKSENIENTGNEIDYVGLLPEKIAVDFEKVRAPDKRKSAGMSRSADAIKTP